MEWANTRWWPMQEQIAHLARSPWVEKTSLSWAWFPLIPGLTFQVRTSITTNCRPWECLEERLHSVEVTLFLCQVPPCWVLGDKTGEGRILDVCVHLHPIRKQKELQCRHTDVCAQISNSFDFHANAMTSSLRRCGTEDKNFVSPYNNHPQWGSYQVSYKLYNRGVHT